MIMKPLLNKVILLFLLVISLSRGELHTFLIRDRVTQVYCLGVEFDGNFVIPYKKQNGEIGVFSSKIDKIISYTGTCSDDMSQISFLYQPVDTVQEYFSFQLHFSNNGHEYQMSKIQFIGRLTKSLIADLKEEVSIQQMKNYHLFTTQNKAIFACSSLFDIPLNDGLIFFTKSLKIEAFVQKKAKIDFIGPTNRCSNDTTHALFVLDGKTNKYCLEVMANFTFGIDYISVNSSVKTFHLNLTNDYNVDQFTGKCSPEESFINYKFDPLGMKDWNMRINFSLKDKKFTMDKVLINGTLDKKEIPDMKDNQLIFNDEFEMKSSFISSPENIMSCKASSTFTGAKNSSMKIENISARAFVELDRIDFSGNKESCAADSGKASAIVPIVIGVILFVLILVALIIFMIGIKKRERYS